jgi:hypothetical protein
VKATKALATYGAYRADLEWFRFNLERNMVGKVTREDLIKVFGKGRAQELGQGTINRRVMALDAWRTQAAVLGGAIEAPEEEDNGPLPLDVVSIKTACDLLTPHFGELRNTSSAFMRSNPENRA